MGVQHAGDVRARLVDRTVDHVARFVDAVVGLRFPNDLALDIDFGEARCRDFLVEHAVKVDQQVVLAARDARGDVVVDQVGHGILVEQAIAGGEIDARLPFLG